MPSLPSGQLVGYGAQPQLFSPDYSVPANREMPDDRLVLFRETTPLMTESKPRFRIQFYNNTSSRSFVVRITGFNQNGFPVYMSKIVK
jgi:hypothetical protein